MSDIGERQGPVILLIEDNPGDALLAAEALKECETDCRLEIVSTGSDALAYLRKQAPFESAVRPILILLDINIPVKNGREVLAEIKDAPELRRIPVVMLTTSGAETDVSSCYDLHANGYVIKSMDIESFIGAMKSIVSFWVNTCVVTS